MYAVVEAWLGLTWPVDCLSCGALTPRGVFCATCAPLVVPRAGRRCTRCDAGLGERGIDGLCRRCEAESPPFDRAWSVFDYIGPVGDAVRAGKYDRRPEAMPAVARALAKHLPPELVACPPGAVVPVPLHPKRLARRALNAPLMLARIVARRLGVPAAPTALVRTRDTRPQAGLSEGERRRNVAAAFQPGRRLPAPDLLLVDDIMTTGATVREAAAALRAAGATRIRVLTLAVADRN